MALFVATLACISVAYADVQIGNLQMASSHAF
jgi:hypothetical protein